MSLIIKHNNHQIACCLVLRRSNYERSIANLEKAKAEVNEQKERFYEFAVHNLLKELQKCSSTLFLEVVGIHLKEALSKCIKLQFIYKYISYLL
jgi:hypothetical protein